MTSLYKHVSSITVVCIMQIVLGIAHQADDMREYDRIKRSNKITYQSCGPFNFTCGDSQNTCIPHEKYCDGEINCPNGSDEASFHDAMPGLGIPCYTLRNDTEVRGCLLTSDWICDGVSGQCLYDNDELCWQSQKTECLVHKSQRCDGVTHCQDGEDESNCNFYTCLKPTTEYEEYYDEYYTDYAVYETNTTEIAHMINISEGNLCDGFTSCNDMADECLEDCPTACGCEKTYKICNNGSLCPSTTKLVCIACADNSAWLLPHQLCDGITDCPDKSDEAHCNRPTDFLCDNGAYVDGSFKCDGKNDCGDWSDECDCLNAFKCANNRCVSAHALCNGIDECGDGSDECLPTCNSRFKFACANGNCISRSSFCNGINECGDGSDEITGNNTTPNIHIMCSNSDNSITKTCVLNQPEWLCDLSDHCEDRADECQPDCLQSFRCDGNKCLKVDAFCNGVQDCEDGTDERTLNDYNSSSHSNLTRCQSPLSNSEKECVLETGHPWLCDGMAQCRDRTDECGSKCQYSFHCSSGQCITRDKVCDGWPDCDDNSDETATKDIFLCTKTRGSIKRTCSLPIHVIYDDVSDCDRDEDLPSNNNFTSINNFFNHTHLNNFFSCVGETITIPGSYVCDGKFDCPLMSDECFCEHPPSTCLNICDSDHHLVANQNTCDACNHGEISCSGEDKCISRLKVCDGVHDCKSGEDEALCSSLVCLQDECTIDFSCGLPSVLCDGFFDCNDFTDECTDQCYDKNANLSNSLCSHIIEHILFEDYTLRTFNCEHDGKYLRGKSVCDGKVFDCPDGRDEMNCYGRFYCNSNNSYADISQHIGAIHISLSQVCDGKIDCWGGEDELNCSSHYYCYGGDPLFVSVDDVMDGKIDCADGSDECPKSSFDSDTFASRDNMIRSWTLRLMVWVMGTLSTVGNITVIIESLMEFPKFSTKRPFAKVHQVLVINLAMADLLMGIYLLSLGFKSSFSLGTYCQKDKWWRSSSHCETLGTMAVVSSVTSVLILLIMTSYRLYAVLKPFKCQNLKYLKAIGFAASAWTLSFLLAFLPRMVTLSDYFWSDVWISTNRFFKQDVVPKANLTRFVRMLSVYRSDDRSLSNFSESAREESTIFGRPGSTWVDIKHELISVFGTDVIKGHFGYYSVHSVCMPKIYVTTEDTAWEYSLVLVCFHFVAFIYILFAYFVIYLKSSRNIQSTNNRQSKMNKRITSLVASDVVCWMPICVMAFLKFSGVEISHKVYAISAIVLLPVNSALNPLLYSDAIQTIFEKATHCIRKRKLPIEVFGSNEVKLSLTTKGVSGPPNEWISSRMDQNVINPKIAAEYQPNDKMDAAAEEIMMLKMSKNTENNNLTKDDDSVVSTYDNYF